MKKMKRLEDSKRHISCRALKVLKCLVRNYTKGNKRGRIWRRIIDILGFTLWNVNLQTTKEGVIFKFNQSKIHTGIGRMQKITHVLV